MDVKQLLIGVLLIFSYKQLPLLIYAKICDLLLMGPSSLLQVFLLELTWLYILLLATFLRPRLGRQQLTRWNILILKIVDVAGALD
jgi:hypothetical protein